MAHRMEYAIRHWLRPCFGGKGELWVNEKTIFYRKELAFKVMTAGDFDTKDRVVCRRKGSDEKWKVVETPKTFFRRKRACAHFAQ